MQVSLRYLYTKTLKIDPMAKIADEYVAPLAIQWIGVASTRFASHGGFLYFVAAETEVPSAGLDPSSMFGCLVKASLSSLCQGIPRIIVSDECNLDTLFDFLVKEMDSYRRWHDTVNNLLLNDASYQELVDATAQFVPRPLYIADARWRMISRVDFEMPEISATWHYQTLHDGLYPLSVVEVLNRTGEYHHISNLPRAELLHSPAFVIPIIAKPIRFHGKLVGYFFMIDTWGDLGPCEEEISEEFGQMLAPVMATRGVQHGTMGSIQDNFITLIIDRMITNRRDIARQLKTETRWNLESDYRLVTTRFLPEEFDNHLLHMRTMGQLMSNFDSHAYLYHDMCITLFRGADADKDEFASHLQRSCAALKRALVVSDRFRDFTQLPMRYEQNKRALELAELSEADKPQVVYCDQLVAYRLAELCRDALPSCYEADVLHSYDLEHGTSYCRTLLTFLSHERNAIAASKALFIHRNTLRNQLAKINEIVQLDLDNAKLRLLLIISLNVIVNTVR